MVSPSDVGGRRPRALAGQRLPGEIQVPITQAPIQGLATDVTTLGVVLTLGSHVVLAPPAPCLLSAHKIKMFKNNWLW